MTRRCARLENGARYAEVLLDIADAVRQQGGRLIPQGVGVGGSGRLGARIDSGPAAEVAHTSAVRGVALTGACAATIFLAAACQRQFVMPPPLQEDEAVVRQVADERARRHEFGTSSQMTAEGAATLEAVLRQNPDNAGVRTRLLRFYVLRGTALLGREAAIEGWRRHALWFLDNTPGDPALLGLPDSGLRAFLLPDPEGYAVIQSRWERHVEGPDVTPEDLQNAASFWSATDMARAEHLLQRAIAGRTAG